MVLSREDAREAVSDISGISTTTVEKDSSDGGGAGGSLIDDATDFADESVDDTTEKVNDAVNTVEEVKLDRFSTLEEAEAAFDQGRITAEELAPYARAYANGNLPQGEEIGITTAEKVARRRESQDSETTATSSGSDSSSGLSTKQIGGIAAALGLAALALRGG